MKTRRKFFQDTTTAGIAAILASRVPPVYAKQRVTKDGISMEEAWEVHRKCLIIDAHQDTSVRRFARNENPKDWMKRDISYHSDLPRMTEGGQQYVGLFLIEDAARPLDYYRIHSGADRYTS